MAAKKKTTKKKTVTKKKTTTKKPPVRTPTAARGRTASLIAQATAMAEAKRFEGSGLGYFKADKGINRVRFIIPPGSTVAFLKYGLHTFGSGRDFRAYLDYKDVAKKEHVNKFLSRDYVTERDLELYKEYGEPFDVLYKELKALGLQKAYRDARPGKLCILTYVWHEDKLKIFEPSQGFYQNVLNLVSGIEDEDNPGHYLEEPYLDLLDHEYGQDISFIGTGDGFGGPNGRRYGTFKVVGEPYAIDFSKIDVQDLWDVAGRKIVSYPEKVSRMIHEHPSLCKEAGITLDTFDLDKDDIPF